MASEGSSRPGRPEPPDPAFYAKDHPNMTVEEVTTGLRLTPAEHHHLRERVRPLLQEHDLINKNFSKKEVKSQLLGVLKSIIQEPDVQELIHDIPQEFVIEAFKGISKRLKTNKKRESKATEGRSETPWNVSSPTQLRGDPVQAAPQTSIPKPSMAPQVTVSSSKTGAVERKLSQKNLLIREATGARRRALLDPEDLADGTADDLKPEHLSFGKLLTFLKEDIKFNEDVEGLVVLLDDIAGKPREGPPSPEDLEEAMSINSQRSLKAVLKMYLRDNDTQYKTINILVVPGRAQGWGEGGEQSREESKVQLEQQKVQLEEEENAVCKGGDEDKRLLEISSMGAAPSNIQDRPTEDARLQTGSLEDVAKTCDMRNPLLELSRKKQRTGSCASLPSRSRQSIGIEQDKITPTVERYSQDRSTLSPSHNHEGTQITPTRERYSQEKSSLSPSHNRDVKQSVEDERRSQEKGSLSPSHNRDVKQSVEDERRSQEKGSLSPSHNRDVKQSVEDERRSQEKGSLSPSPNCDVIQSVEDGNVKEPAKTAKPDDPTTLRGDDSLGSASMATSSSIAITESESEGVNPGRVGPIYHREQILPLPSLQSVAAVHGTSNTASLRDLKGFRPVEDFEGPQQDNGSHPQTPLTTQKAVWSPRRDENTAGEATHLLPPRFNYINKSDANFTRNKRGTSDTSDSNPPHAPGSSRKPPRKRRATLILGSSDESMGDKREYQDTTDEDESGRGDRDTTEEDESGENDLKLSFNAETGEVTNGIMEEFCALQDSDVCEQLDPELWRECCVFFRHNPEKADSSVRIQVKGLRRGLMLHQMYCVYWMLNTERSRSHGGFVGDEMGLGKTTEVVALIAVSYLLNKAHMKVEQSRKNKDKKHLEKGTTKYQQPADAKCPAGEPFAMCCPCVDRNPSAKLLPKLGATLILVPPGLIPTWIREWDAIVGDNDTSNIGMRRVIAHQQGTGPEVFTDEDITTIGWSNLTTKDDKAHIIDEVPHVKAARITVFSSPQSYLGQVAKKLEFHVKDWRPPKARKHTSSVYEGITWGRVVRDEFHLEKSVQSSTPFRLKRWTTPYKWMLSGTPFEVSPRDLLGYITALYSTAWDTDPVLSMCTPSKIEQLGSAFEMCVKSGDREKAADIAQDFQKVLKRLMIRRRAASRWLDDKELVHLPPVESKDIECDFPNEYRPALKALQAERHKQLIEDFKLRTRRWEMSTDPRKGERPNGASLGAYMSLAFTLRLISTVPFLVRLSHDRGMSMTGSELKANNWVTTDQGNPYVENLETIVKSSPKLRALGDIVAKLGQDVDGNPEKLVVMSFSPVIAFVVYRYLVSHLRQRAELYHAGLKTKDRIAMISRFQEQDAEHRTDTRLKVNPTILVGTTGLMGIGMTLTRAFRSVLMEPDWVLKTENQAQARIRRIGQKNEPVYWYRLLTRGDETEKAILQRQDLRLHFRDLTFTGKSIVPSEDKAEANEFLDLDDSDVIV
ncbi:MAG: hypothetical protein M4579_006527 [Chaenotheca gracillima]|nr:MAG: hypothetical protein M4579_006527 [Chaenotheca gracillima]